MSVIRKNELDEEQNAHVRYAVLLLHTGGPRELTTSSVLSYMSQKFSAPRLVEPVPRYMWYPILYSFVLPFSYTRVRKLYASSWIHPQNGRRPSGSVAIQQPGSTPAVFYTDLLAQSLAAKITDMIQSATGEDTVASTPWARRGSSVSHASIPQNGDAPPVTYSIQVEAAYTAQSGSVDDALARFRLHGNYMGIRDTAKRSAMVLDERLIILPLYPQYSSLSTGTAFDAVMRSRYFSRSVCLPHLSFVHSYCDHHSYIAALECSVRSFVAQHGVPDLLLVIFDDTPNRYGGAGDSYGTECKRTFMALTQALTGPQLASPLGAWGSTSAHCSPLSEESISMCFVNISPGATPAARADARVLLQTPRRLAVEAATQDVSSLAVSSVTAPVESVNITAEAPPVIGEAREDEAVQQSPSQGANGIGSVYLLFPGAVVETAESLSDSKQLCQHALKCGWSVAKTIPSLNNDPTHVEMLTSILTSEM